MSTPVSASTGARHGDRIGRGDGAASEAVRQRLALDELHDQGQDAIAVLEAVNGANVRMIERCQRPRLALEPRQPIRIVGERGWKDLDRHVAAKSGIPRPVNLAHAARTERSYHVVGTET